MDDDYDDNDNDEATVVMKFDDKKKNKNESNSLVLYVELLYQELSVCAHERCDVEWAALEGIDEKLRRGVGALAA